MLKENEAAKLALTTCDRDLLECRQNIANLKANEERMKFENTRLAKASSDSQWELKRLRRMLEDSGRNHWNEMKKKVRWELRDDSCIRWVSFQFLPTMQDEMIVDAKKLLEATQARLTKYYDPVWVS